MNRPEQLASFVGAILALIGAFSAAAPVEVRVIDPSGKPLAGAVVFLESAEAAQSVKPLTGAEISQVSKSFVPAVTVVPLGTAVSFPNRDVVRHHVYSFSSVKRFEIKLYVGTPANPVVFDRPGIAVLGCNIHDSMVAWVVVVETPWYGQTGADGRWSAPNVPAGNYRLRTWHSRLPVGAPAADQPLRIEPAGAQTSVRLSGVTW